MELLVRNGGKYSDGHTTDRHGERHDDGKPEEPKRPAKERESDSDTTQTCRMPTNRSPEQTWSPGEETGTHELMAQADENDEDGAGDRYGLVQRLLA